VKERGQEKQQVLESQQSIQFGGGLDVSILDEAEKEQEEEKQREAKRGKDRRRREMARKLLLLKPKRRPTTRMRHGFRVSLLPDVDTRIKKANIAHLILDQTSTGESRKSVASRIASSVASLDVSSSSKDHVLHSTTVSKTALSFAHEQLYGDRHVRVPASLMKQNAPLVRPVPIDHEDQQQQQQQDVDLDDVDEDVDEDGAKGVAKDVGKVVDKRTSKRAKKRKKKARKKAKGNNNKPPNNQPPNNTYNKSQNKSQNKAQNKEPNKPQNNSNNKTNKNRPNNTNNNNNNGKIQRSKPKWSKNKRPKSGATQ